MSEVDVIEAEQPKYMFESFEDLNDVVIKKGTIDINLATELKYAKEVYKKACEGFEDNPPPPPSVWLDHGKQLAEGWENYKAATLAIASEENTHPEHKKDIEDFLKCATSRYMDLMSKIYETFLKDVDQKQIIENA